MIRNERGNEGGKEKNEIHIEENGKNETDK